MQYSLAYRFLLWSFPVFQLFQNQQDITDEKMSNNSLLINKQQMQQVDPSGLSHEDSQ
jgi:hypothetical protein